MGNNERASFRFRNNHTFAIIWLGQTVSLIGSGLTDFALGVWVYEVTNSVTQYALIYLSITIPSILVAPLAGSLVDRWDRRRAMILSDTGAGLVMLAVALLLLADRLAIWHIYVAVAANAGFSAVQWLAYSSTISLLVPKEHLGRAGGLTRLAQAFRLVLSPFLAGFLLVTFSLETVILLDFVTFLFAVLTLLTTRIPRPQALADETHVSGSFLRDVLYGWRYLWVRPSLMGLLIFFSISNFLDGVVTVLGPPFLLSLSSASALGMVMSIGGGGMLVGGLVMSVWGGPRRRILGVLGFEAVGGLCIAIAGLKPSILLFAVLGTIFFFRIPIADGSRDAIWLSKVPPAVQGRIFAVRRVVAWSTRPLAYLVAGPLADGVFEPLMSVDGLLATSVGRIIGVGPGRGIGLLFMVVGGLIVMAAVIGYLYPPLRHIDEKLPDRDSVGAPSHQTIASN